MTENDRPIFAQLLSDAMAFYRQDVSDFALSVWWSTCQRYEFSQVQKAFSLHATNPDGGQFAPKPADLVRILSGTISDKAQIAWGKAFDAASRVGAYQDVVFDDPAIHAVIEDLGGWVKFCRSETKDLSYLQHRFGESYRAYAGRESFQFARVLSGASDGEAAYKKFGLEPPKPILIGDAEVAKKVYANGLVGGKTAISIGNLLDAVPKRLEAA